MLSKENTEETTNISFIDTDKVKETLSYINTKEKLYKYAVLMDKYLIYRLSRFFQMPKPCFQYAIYTFKIVLNEIGKNKVKDSNKKLIVYAVLSFKMADKERVIKNKELLYVLNNDFLIDISNQELKTTEKDFVKIMSKKSNYILYKIIPISLLSKLLPIYEGKVASSPPAGMLLFSNNIQLYCNLCQLLDTILFDEDILNFSAREIVIAALIFMNVQEISSNLLEKNMSEKKFFEFFMSGENGVIGNVLKNLVSTLEEDENHKEYLIKKVCETLEKMVKFKDINYKLNKLNAESMKITDSEELKKIAAFQCRIDSIDDIIRMSKILE